VERLARHDAACYVETPAYESQLALEVLTSWFDERTADWVADEYVRAGMAMSPFEAGISTALRASIPRRAHGPRERESLPASQTSPPTMDIYHGCATEGCTALVCNGGDRQHMQSPYCSDACWHAHAKDGLAHEPADTKAWADDTTNAIWRRGRLKDMQISPRGVGTPRVNTGIGDPLANIFYQTGRKLGLKSIPRRNTELGISHHITQTPPDVRASLTCGLANQPPYRGRVSGRRAQEINHPPPHTESLAFAEPKGAK
jgi:hypothetical protein